jgi:membrane protein DedA with SNARE-associated domain
VVSAIVDWIEELARSPWFYLLVYAIAVLDSIIPVVPSEAAVIIGGVAAGTGNKWLLGVIIVAALGAITGDNMAYLIGRKASDWLESRRNERRQQSRLDWARRQLQKRGGVLILTARFIPGGRTAVTVMSGVTRQLWIKFLFFTIVAGAAWATYAALLGYIGGRRFEDNHTAAFLVAFGLAISVSLLIELGRWMWHRRRRFPTPSC